MQETAPPVTSFGKAAVAQGYLFILPPADLMGLRIFHSVGESPRLPLEMIS